MFIVTDPGPDEDIQFILSIIESFNLKFEFFITILFHGNDYLQKH